MTLKNSYKTSPSLRPIVTPIVHILQQTPNSKSFVLKAPEIAKNATPGQFLMVWIPGIDEIPMSISNTIGDQVEFTAAKVGEATTRLHELKAGDLLGLRGPLGQGFQFPSNTKKKPLLLVAGGCGSPPVYFAAVETIKQGFTVDSVLGASTENELLFHDAFKKLNLRKFIVTTDDGSAGQKGTSVDAVSTLLERGSNYAACFACGPEGMLVSLYQLMKPLPIALQFSLERYMKCGVGICGHCIIDDQGRRVCHEGPVFEAQTLEGSDFGRWTRDVTGKRQRPNNTEVCPH
ncbi:MAG: dihydroorotate dehydrogenase electron transfer subunit [Candidatus Hodarchaeota archaeon]